MERTSFWRRIIGTGLRLNSSPSKLAPTCADRGIRPVFQRLSRTVSRQRRARSALLRRAAPGLLAGALVFAAVGAPGTLAGALLGSGVAHATIVERVVAVVGDKAIL